MNIVETRVYALGNFTIQQRPRPDSPGWAVYVVLYQGKVIGKQFSVPTISDCEWLSRQKSEELVYAVANESIKHVHQYSIDGKNSRTALTKARAYGHTSRERKTTA